jgi:hypothetical protein
MSTERAWGFLGRALGLLTMTAVLAGCGGSGSDGSANEAASGTASAEAASSSPTVSGHPAVTAVANADYSFQPVSSHAAGTSLIFSIENKPA